MLNTPYKGAGLTTISQTFHEGHKALDLVVWRSSNALTRGYGTPLCAPERSIVRRIVGDSYTPGSDHNLERGYGIFLLGVETGFTHEYWHTQPIHPVSEGDVVQRGQIVAYMGNAGNVRAGTRYVPLEERTSDPFPGTHLHWEIMDRGYTIGGRKKHLNPLDHINWTLQPTYTTGDQLRAMAVVFGKMLKITK